MIVFIKSIIIGICAILPGISGSVIAVSLGIYEEFIDKIKDIKSIKKNLKYIFIVLFGIIIGIYLTSFVLIFFLKNNSIFYYILLGIILSEIPFLINKIRINTSQNIQIITCLISFFISILLNTLNCNKVMESSPFMYYLGGILFSFGKIFPGISSSFLLLSLGIYEDIILVITNPFLVIHNYYMYFPFLLGFLSGTVIFVILLKYMLKNMYRTLYSIIIGLVISSVFIMIPKLSIVGVIILLLSLIFSYRIKNKKDEKK